MTLKAQHPYSCIIHRILTLPLSLSDNSTNGGALVAFQMVEISVSLEGVMKNTTPTRWYAPIFLPTPQWTTPSRLWTSVWSPLACAPYFIGASSPKETLNKIEDRVISMAVTGICMNLSNTGDVMMPLQHPATLQQQKWTNLEYQWIGGIFLVAQSTVPRPK